MTNVERDRSLKNYFVNRRCIKYDDVQQLLRFDEPTDQLDYSRKLPLVVSIDSLDSLRNRYDEMSYRSLPFYYLIVSEMDDKL